MDEYKRAAAEDEEQEPPLEVGVAVEASTVQGAVSQGRSLDQTAANAQAEVDAISVSGSERADELRRQLEDVRGLNRMGAAEIRMPRAFGSLLRRTSSKMRPYPAVIRSTVDKMERGVDVAHVLWKRWDEFQSNGVEFVFSEIKKCIAAVEPILQIIERKNRSTDATEFSSITDACIYVLRQNGNAMTAKSIYLELEKNPAARDLIAGFPKKKPYKRISTLLMKRRDRVGDVQDVGAGFWSTSVSKGEKTKLEKARLEARNSAQSHSEKTKHGMQRARQQGGRFGPDRSL